MEEKLEKDPLSEHVQILLMEYSRTSENKNALKFANNVNVSQQSDEKYEKSNPLHGDKLFHTFLSRIKLNPDQIIRYVCQPSQSTYWKKLLIRSLYISATAGIIEHLCFFIQKWIFHQSVDTVMEEWSSKCKYYQLSSIIYG